jgi:hypothetical protein
MKTSIPTIAFLLALLISACTPTSNTGGTQTPSPCNFQSNGDIVCTIPFSRAVPNNRIPPPPPPKAPPIAPLPGTCLPGTIDLVNQTVSGTASITIHLNDDQSINTSVSVPDGVYVGSISPLGPKCGALGTTSPIKVTFALTYLGDADKSLLPVCIFQSQVDFSAFVITGFDPVDKVISDLVKDNVLQSLDFTIADELNKQSLIGNGTPLPSGNDPRCNPWKPRG